MSDDSFLREKAREVIQAGKRPNRSPDHVRESEEESNGPVQRLFVLAAQRVGSASALGQHLGLTDSELRPYLAGEAIPPEEVLLRTADLAIEDLKMVKSGFSEQAWRSLWLPTR
jgi:hypothetical protein